MIWIFCPGVSCAAFQQFTHEKDQLTKSPWLPGLLRSHWSSDATADVKSRSSRTAAKKGGKGLGARKALKDTTNKSSFPPEVLSRKNLPKEEFNIAEEMFLHDHNKCIEERKAALNDFDLNLVFPGYDEEEQWKLSEGLPEVDFDSFRCYPEPTELPMPSVSDILGPSSWSISPPSSPLASMDSDFFWEFQEVEFVLNLGGD